MVVYVHVHVCITPHACIFFLGSYLTAASCVLCSDHVLDILVIYCGVPSPCKSHILLCMHQREGWGLG